jgi:hypothetical protein
MRQESEKPKFRAFETNSEIVKVMDLDEEFL